MYSCKLKLHLYIKNKVCVPIFNIKQILTKKTGCHLYPAGGAEPALLGKKTFNNNISAGDVETHHS